MTSEIIPVMHSFSVTDIAIN